MTDVHRKRTKEGAREEEDGRDREERREVSANTEPTTQQKQSGREKTGKACDNIHLHLRRSSGVPTAKMDIPQRNSSLSTAPFPLESNATKMRSARSKGTYTYTVHTVNDSSRQPIHQNSIISIHRGACERNAQCSAYITQACVYKRLDVTTMDA